MYARGVCGKRGQNAVKNIFTGIHAVHTKAVYIFPHRKCISIGSYASPKHIINKVCISVAHTVLNSKHYIIYYSKYISDLD